MDAAPALSLQCAMMGNNRILSYSVTPEELDEFIAWALSRADVRLLARTNATDPPPTYRALNEVVDARGPDHRTVLLWNASISPPPITEKRAAEDDGAGGEIYLVDWNFSDVAELGGPSGRLYTCDQRSDAFKKWFQSLVRWFKRRCKYYEDHDWISPAQVERIPGGERFLTVSRRQRLRASLDDINELLAFANETHDVVFAAKESPTQQPVTFSHIEAEQPHPVGGRTSRIDEMLGAGRPKKFLIWNQSLFPEIKLARCVVNGSDETSYVLNDFTTVIVISRESIRMPGAVREAYRTMDESGQRLIEWYGSILDWLRRRDLIIGSAPPRG